MKTKIIMLFTSLLILTAAAGGFAEGLQEAQKDGPAAPVKSAASIQGPKVPYDTMTRGSRLIGEPIFHSKTGEEIGQVEDLIFDITDGYTPYLLITVQGVESLGPNDLVPLPIYLISISEDRNRLELLIDDMQTLEYILPVEDMDVYEQNGIDWTRRFYPYWQNITPAQQGTVRSRMRDLRHYRFSYGAGRRFAPSNTLQHTVLLDQPIQTPEGERLADIADTIVSLESGGLYYLVIEPLTKYDYENRYYMVPLNTLTLNTREETILFALKKYTLNRAPGFNEELPEIDGEPWPKNVERYWEKRGLGVNMRIGMRVIPVSLAESDAVLGVSVSNHMYQNIGTIEDLMVRRNDEELSYAVIEFGGVFDIKDRRTLVPFNAVTLNKIFDLGFVNIDRQEVENAPYFEEGSIPKTDMYEPWDIEIEEYWRKVFFIEEYKKRERKVETVSDISTLDRAQALPLTRMLDFTVSDSEGKIIGEVENFIIDMENQKILYALVSVEGEIGGNPAVVPFSRFLWDAPAEQFVVGIEKNVLEQAPRYEDISESREAGWEEGIRDYWQGY